MTDQTGKPFVHIILVNWNNWPDTLECVQSLERLDYPNFLILVIDNESLDTDSEESLIGSERLRVIKTDRNLGFAGGVNVGLRIAIHERADYVWILNNDTVVRPDALRWLVTVAEQYKQEMFVGSWITYYDRPSVLWFGGGRYRWGTGTMEDDTSGKQTASVDDTNLIVATSWITGCSILVRRTGVEQIGLLDESYFLYREEVEWQLRRDPKRPHAVLIREPLVRHKVGRSTGMSQGYLGTIFMSRNYLKLMKRYAHAAAPLWMLRWFIEYLVKPALKGETSLLAAALDSLFLIRTPGSLIVEKARLRKSHSD